MATTRAKFRCNSITLMRSNRVNPDILDAIGAGSDYRQIQDKAEELGVPAYVDFDQPTVELTPVVADTDENRSFWNATPSGKISLTISNHAAAEVFELARDYYVDFTPADA